MKCSLCKVALKKGDDSYALPDGREIHASVFDCRQALMDEVFELRREVDVLCEANIKLANRGKEADKELQEPSNMV